jgi:hypothetical protein
MPGFGGYRGVTSRSPVTVPIRRITAAKTAAGVRTSRPPLTARCRIKVKWGIGGFRLAASPGFPAAPFGAIRKGAAWPTCEPSAKKTRNNFWGYAGNWTKKRIS